MDTDGSRSRVAPPIDDFAGRIAVVTGGASGMGRELTIQLAGSGADVAICDLDEEGLAATLELAAKAGPGVRLTSAVADVAERGDLDVFARHVGSEFDTESIHLLFNNAGISGAQSVVRGDPAEWDRVFAVTWGGVLHGTRAFLPMLVAAARSQVINTASISSMWACLGAHGPHTCYCTAKYAVRGFTESLIVDFRVNAPHVTAAVVMPGHVGTPIARKSLAAVGLDHAGQVSDAYIAQTRESFARRGVSLDAATDDDVRRMVADRIETFERTAPTTAVDAASQILDGVRQGEWRILIGPDAYAIDAAVRTDPAAAYTPEFTEALTAEGHFLALVIPR